MTTSVVMVSYHTGQALFAAIDAVLTQEGLGELIVVDHGNPPETHARLQALASADDRVKHLHGHGNIGFARGCNLGARQAEGEYIMLLNPDCLLPPGAFLPLTAALERTGAWLAGPRIHNPDGSEQRGCRRPLLTPKTAVAQALNMKVSGLNMSDAPGAKPVPAISGACMFLPLERYRQLGGMDEAYFLHVEDLDFCLRVHQAGGSTVFVPDVAVLHLLSTSNAPSAFVEMHKARGFARYFARHFSRSPWRWPLTLLAWLRAWARILILAKNKNGKASLQVLGLVRFMEEEKKAPSALSFRGRSVMLTGATSAIGLCLMGRLLQSGARVTAFSRAPLAFSHPYLRWQQADLAALPELGAAEHAVHCAPLWLLPPALPGLHKAGIRRIVAFGSTSVFGKAGSGNAQERQTVMRLEAAEREIAAFCQTHVMGLTLLRPTLIYGLGLDGNVTRLARLIKRFRVLPYFPPARGLRQPVHADDLAVAALQALEKGAEGAYDLSGGETLTYRAMAERIFAALGKKPRLIPAPFLAAALDFAARLRHNSGINGEMIRRMNADLIFSHEAAARDFGYAPRAFLSERAVDLGEWR